MDEVAIRLGITVQRLRKLRASLLTEAVDWMRDPDDDRRVLFTAEGVEKIRAEITGIPVGPQGRGGDPEEVETEAGSDAPEPPGEALASPAPPISTPARENPPCANLSAPALDTEEELEVVSSPRQFADGSVRHHPNPHVISARRACGEVVYVRVTSSEHFTTRLADGSPMKLTARYGGEPPIWFLVGRCPRWRGRW